MQLSRFLRTILKLDGVSCLLMAAGLVPGAAILEPLLGMPAPLLASAGLSLVPIGLFILWLGTRSAAPQAMVYLVIFGNLGWTAASFGVLAVLSMISPLGAGVLVGQALAVAAFALLELRGARESRWASAV